MRSFPVPARRVLLIPLMAGGLLLSACGEETAEDPATTPTPSASPSASPSESPTESPSASEAPASTGLVYYSLDTRAGLRLAREPRRLEGADATEVAASAVEAMVAGPDDPDYGTTWNPDTQVLGVTQDGDTVTVDLSAEAREANVGSPGAALMIQQLVWTVTEAVDPEASVLLTIDGEPAGELWGAVSWGEPVTRDDPMDVRLMVQIDNLAEGATVSSPVTVEGEANAFEANVPWRVLDETGQVVEEGFTMAAEGMTFSPYSFEVELEPGTYTVEVTEDDPSGGEGGEPMSDSRTITVE